MDQLPALKATLAGLKPKEELDYRLAIGSPCVLEPAGDRQQIKSGWRRG